MAVVLLESNAPTAPYLPKFDELEAGADAIAVDIPIGLRTTGRRTANDDATPGRSSRAADR